MALDTVERARLRKNEEPDTGWCKLSIDADFKFESAEGGVERVVGPLLFSPLRRAAGWRRGAVSQSPPVEQEVTVKTKGPGELWRVSVSSSSSKRGPGPSAMASWQKEPSTFLTAGEADESISSPLLVVSKLSSLSDDE